MCVYIYVYIYIYIVFSDLSFSKTGGVYEIPWKNIVQADSPEMTIWRIRIACWIPKATDTHSQYVIIIAFPLQHWLTRTDHNVELYIACLVCYSVLLYIAAETCRNQIFMHIINIASCD